MRAACNGAAPPKATRVRPRASLPLSIAWTRAALAMFSSTISLTPRAASSSASASGSAISWRRAGPAAPIAGGAGVSPGTVRPDGDPFQPIDPGDRPAAGADLDHFDDRNAQRQPASLLEAIDARDLEGAPGRRLEGVVKE